MKNISVLGSTGSIGTQTLEIVRNNGDIRVTALAAGHNITMLEAQIREFKPRIACVWDEEKARELKITVADLPVKVVSGMEGMIEAATEEEAQIVVTAVVGMIGIRPTIAAMKVGKDIALANKETLVTAGHIIMPLAKQQGVRILPVDSEHCAIFQCIGMRPSEAEPYEREGSAVHERRGGVPGIGVRENSQISKILLTASGGPFLGKTREQLKDVQLEDALKHPNWNMGHKITIDSSTMANKGLEVMEAGWLFGVPLSQIQVVIQPKSIIHSMVEFVDGAVLAQMGTPDMKLPIQYALYYPERRFLPGERLDFWSLNQITFEKPDMETFRALALAYRAGETGGSLPTVFNAANEYAVARFIEKKISYLDITEMIENAMSRHKVIENPSVEEILEVEQETYDILRKTAE